MPDNELGLDLQAGHILRRANAVFKRANDKSDEVAPPRHFLRIKADADHEQYTSALTTFDILRHYADLPINHIEDLEKKSTIRLTGSHWTLTPT